MRRHISNATYGVLDYVSYPLGMLVAAPIVLHQIGAAEYGLWMVSTAIVSAGGIIASGFCDAAIQRTAQFRGSVQPRRIAKTVRSLLAINVLLGCAGALVIWILAPAAARHLATSPRISVHECIVCCRIAAVLILIRSLEAVPVSIQRAFEDYRGTVQISAAVRLLTLGAAAIVVCACGGRAISIMLVTAALLATGTVLQFRNLSRFVSASLWPTFRTEETRTLLQVGLFVWVQALGSVLFRQFDRVLLGVSLGAGAVAAYSLCIQLAEPLFGLTASGLSFFFPYLSGRSSTLSPHALRQTILKALLCNFLLVTAGAGFLLIFGNRLLQLWAGRSIAHRGGPILPLIIIASALSGLSVTGVYAAQGLGLFRTIACVNLGNRAALFLLMLHLLRTGGVHGLAVARVLYGAAALLVYVPLLRRFNPWTTTAKVITSLPLPAEMERGVQP
jgi:O-antigen/teichoic acid export membrane protein